MRFCMIFACFAILSVVHRLSAFSVFFGEKDHFLTYNFQRGQEALAHVVSQYGGSFLNGLRADLIFTLPLAAVLIWMPRTVVIMCFLLLSVFYAINVEHVRYNLTSLDMSLIGLGADPSFLIAQLTSDLFLQLLVFVVIGLALLRLARFWSMRGIAVVLTVLALPVAAAPILAINIEQPAWLQSHPLLPKTGVIDVDVASDSFDAGVFERPLLPTVENAPQRKNLLIVYLEGVSQLNVERGDMPYLASLSADHVAYSRYFGHQLVTANGLYSTLTGQLPRFTGSDGDLYWFNMRPDDPEVAASLPHRLKTLGYTTAFIQSAELGFMAKDEMLPMLGFDLLQGDEAFDGWHSRNGWGVDDLTLFEKVVETIDAFPADQPWIVGALTTGTHSPYNIPADFLPDEPSDRIRALKWAD